MSEISRSTGSRSSVVDGGTAVLGEQRLRSLRGCSSDGQQFAHRPLVVDDEDARRAAIVRGSARWAALLMSSPCCDRRARRQAHGDAGADALLRVHANLAVVVGDDAMDDG